MKINARMGRTDRIVNVVAGVGFVAWAFVGDFDQGWVRAALVVFGLVNIVGGIGGL